MKVLVTGGTGFVGQAILRELHRAQHEIHCLVRNPRSRNAQNSAREFSVGLHEGDVLDAASLAHVCDGMDAVIHLVGIISEVGKQTFEAVHTGGTQNIVAAAKAAGVRRFIHMSALGTRPNAVSRYHKSKWAAEEIVRTSALEWTIFRPSIIYGPGDGFVNLFAKIIRRSPIVPILGSGESKFQPIPVESVAIAFTRSLTESRARGQVFDLCGPETFSLNEIVDEVLAVMNRRRWKIHIPLPLAKFQAAFLELFFGKLLHRPPPLNRDQLLMLQEDNVGKGATAMKTFDLNSTSFREGIARYLR